MPTLEYAQYGFQKIPTNYPDLTSQIFLDVFENFEKYKGCLEVTFEFCWKIVMSEVPWLIIRLKRRVEIGKKKIRIKQCLSWHEKKFRYHLTIEKIEGSVYYWLTIGKSSPQYNHIYCFLRFIKPKHILDCKNYCFYPVSESCINNDFSRYTSHYLTHR